MAGLRWNQWVALAAIAGGAIYLVATRGQTWPDADAAVTDDAELDGVGPLDDVDDLDAADAADAADADGEASLFDDTGIDVDGDAGVPPRD